MKTCEPLRIRNHHGMTYLMAMLAIVLMGLTLMMVGQQWSVIIKRDREAELLFRGNRIQAALERFAADYEVLKATRSTRYPLKLEELTKKPRRYLPVVYSDPITGKDFQVIKVGQEIRGVRSESMDVPFDQVNFKGAQTYHAIKFEVAGSTNCRPTPQNPTLPANCAKQPSPSSTSGGQPEGEEGSKGK